jgi:hypothetical protein
MTAVHALIGLGEAVITTVVISIVLASRPDLVTTWNLGRNNAKIAEEV